MKIPTILGAALLLLSTVAFAGDKYWVYKLSNGECEIDQREADKFGKSFSDKFGPFDSRTDAQNKRTGLVKDGSCKCPGGQNC